MNHFSLVGLIEHDIEVAVPSAVGTQVEHSNLDLRAYLDYWSPALFDYSMKNSGVVSNPDCKY